MIPSQSTQIRPHASESHDDPARPAVYDTPVGHRY